MNELLNNCFKKTQSSSKSTTKIHNLTIRWQHVNRISEIWKTREKYEVAENAKKSKTIEVLTKSIFTALQNLYDSCWNLARIDRANIHKNETKRVTFSNFAKILKQILERKCEILFEAFAAWVVPMGTWIPTGIDASKYYWLQLNNHTAIRIVASLLGHMASGFETVAAVARKLRTHYRTSTVVSKHTRDAASTKANRALWQNFFSEKGNNAITTKKPRIKKLQFENRKSKMVKIVAMPENLNLILGAKNVVC